MNGFDGKVQEKIKSRTVIFNLGSASCDNMLNGSALSNGIWTIDNFINRDENVEQIYFSVIHAEIPNSFYLINQYNCNLSITNTGITTVYFVPFGNYNINTLLVALRSLMSGYTITYSSLTSKITISNTGNFQINLGSTISRIMGLSKTNDMISTYSGGVYTLVCPFLVNLFPTARLNLRSSFLQLDNYHANDRSNDVFLSLQNNANQGGMILYSNPSGLKHSVDIDNLNQLDIRITDDSNRLLDFQNSAWFLTIGLEITYKTIPTNLNFSKILKNNNQLLTELFSKLLD